MLQKTLKTIAAMTVLASVTSYADNTTLPTELQDCLQKQTYSERQTCLQMNIDLLRLQQELKNLAGMETEQKQPGSGLGYDVPQPIGVFSGPKAGKYVEFSYQGGILSGYRGDTLAAGWTIKKITNTSVTLTRQGKDLVMSYGSGSGSSNSIVPVMDSPIVAAPARPHTAQPAMPMPPQPPAGIR